MIFLWNGNIGNNFFCLFDRYNCNFLNCLILKKYIELFKKRLIDFIFQEFDLKAVMERVFKCNICQEIGFLEINVEVIKNKAMFFIM